MATQRAGEGTSSVEEGAVGAASAPSSSPPIAPPAEEPPRGPLPWRLWLHLYRFFVAQWRLIDDEARAERHAAGLGAAFDARPLWALIVASLVLVFEEYYGDRPTYRALFSAHTPQQWESLAEFAWWAGSKGFGYVLVPATVMWLARVPVRDCGLRLRGFLSHAWIYAALFFAIVPVVVAASYTSAFQATYPFYRLAPRSWFDLLAWESLYALSFLALEFFFRGFLLFALRRTFGAAAIFVAIVPYCMIHFHKPVAEVVGAIFAGIVLGTLALRTRSIWCGVLIHVSVALTMDLLAIAHTTGFPGSGRFVGE